MPAKWRPQGGELLVDLGVVGCLELDEQGGVGALGQHGVELESCLRTRARKWESMISTAVGEERGCPGTASPDANTEGK